MAAEPIREVAAPTLDELRARVATPDKPSLPGDLNPKRGDPRLFEELLTSRNLIALRQGLVQKLHEAVHSDRVLLLTSILNLPDPLRVFSLELLNHVKAGKPGQGMSPFAGVRWLVKHEGKKPRVMKIDTHDGDVFRTDHAGHLAGYQQQSDTVRYAREYMRLEPGQEVWVQTPQAVHLLLAYGRDVGHRPSRRREDGVYCMIEAARKVT